VRARADGRQLAVAGAALAARLVVLAQLHDHPLLQPGAGLDSGAYVTLARRVAAGDLWLGPEAYFVSPLYIYFLAAVFALTGGSILAAQSAQVLLGTAAVALIHADARRWLGAGRAWIAGLLAAATGVFVFHEVTLLQAALDPFLTALALHLLTRAVQAQGPAWSVAAGAGFGLLALNRPNALACALAAAAGLVWIDRRRTLGLLAGVALAVAPIAVRNHIVSGETVLVSSHGGLNFYIGNNPEADGTYRAPAGVTPSIEGQARDAIRMASAGLGRPVSAGEASAWFFRRAREWILGHPGAALRLFARKLALTLNDGDVALNYSYAYYSRDEPGLLRWLVVGPWVLVPLGLVGLAWRARAAGGFFVWALFAPVYAVSVAAFFVSTRYRLPLLVPLCLGAAETLAVLAAELRRRRWRTLAAIAAAVIPLDVIASWRFGLDDGRQNERTEMVLYLVDNGRLDEARPLLARAEAADREPALLLFRVGRALQERGQAREAAELLERAARLEPERAEARLALGQALLDSGRAQEAIGHLRMAREAGVRADLAGVDLARALAAAGRRAEAVDALRRVPIPAADPAGALALGRLALQLDEPAFAEKALRSAVASAPQAAEPREALGIALLGLDRPSEAAEQLEAAVRLDPKSASAQLNLAVVDAQSGRFEDARRHAQEALRLKPDYPQARGLLDALTRRR
jgi:tetratricopeptide (TPR) repeat protein